MHIGSLHSIPQKLSVFTGRDSITGELSGLGEITQPGITLFPADIAKQISDEFAPYRSIAEKAAVMPKQIQTQVNGWTQWQGNPAYFQIVMQALRALPTWYAQGGTIMGLGNTAVPFLNVQQGANGNTGYVSYRVITRNGLKIWEVPYQYGLNEGTQTITNDMAAAAGGIPTPVGGYTIQSGAAIVGPRWMFLQDPRPYLRVGVIGAGYVGGRSGKSITMEAVKGIAIVVGSVVGGALIGAALGPAVGAASSAGSAAGSAAGAAAGGAGSAAGAAAGTAASAAGTAAGAGAGIVGSAGAATGIAAPALITSAGTGVGTTAVAAAAPAVAATAAPAVSSGFLPGLLAAGKTAAGVLTTAVGVQKALTAAKPSGGASGAPPALVPDYGGSGYGGGAPTGGVDFFSQSFAGVPLWLLIVGGGTVVFLATRRKRK